MDPITHCRSCGAGDLVEVLDLGNQYLSDFRDDDIKPPRYPLVLLLCPACTLVQLAHTTPRAEMYHDRYGFKSGVNEAVRADLAEIVDYALTHKPVPSKWLDIACNDGTLLSFVPRHIYRVGVDPVTPLAAEACHHANHIVCDYFDPKYFDNEDRFNVVTSISMFYDLDDPNEFVDGVKQVLADDGIWVIQQNYLLTMLEQNAVDNVCHEHVTYFSLTALQHLLNRHGLEVNDVVMSPVNGGCVRTLVSRQGTHRVDPAVAAQEAHERRQRIGDPATYRAFASRVNTILTRLTALVRDINRTGRVYIYGASTRGGTIWQAAGLTVADLPYAVERNPTKVGKKIASIGVPIISEEQARADQPHAMLVSPWFFRDVFVQREADYLRAGGKLIFPLPELEIVDARGIR